MVANRRYNKREGVRRARERCMETVKIRAQAACFYLVRL
jgi:hypothetical protein